MYRFGTATGYIVMYIGKENSKKLFYFLSPARVGRPISSREQKFKKFSSKIRSDFVSRFYFFLLNEWTFVHHCAVLMLLEAQSSLIYQS